ncbi:TonB-dependent siderophore receptor [Rugamonas sp. DEMB1]|uniref:TonB-dependent receptor family protein n=1 Tax=Rugamonas sp. DEMB1 TaxID=3039386 RepID=UPI002447C931|nr:TonB-dependent siderophore receptor [Rugamonas sp. DEMB1]WGG52509.1 TonB-dependent siderophore receptor [Rugamonas sp. DEMB1]
MSQLPHPPARRAIAAACALLSANLALAQAAAPGDATVPAADAPVETVQVSGNWLGSGQRSLKNFGGARSVVKREAIEASGASSVSDVLRAVPGLQVTDNSSSGGSAISLNIGVRGLDGRFSPRSTVLLDGIPLAVAPYGQPQLSFAPVSLANIDSIDVVRGGGAVRYGPQNVGGIINFKTRAIPQAELAAEASVRVNQYDGGNSGTQYSAFVGGRADGGLGVALLYSGVDGSGFRRHSREKINDVALKFSYPLAAGAELNTKLAYYDAESQLPGGLSRAQFAADPRQSVRTRDSWSGSRKSVDVGYVKPLSATREIELRSYFTQSSRASVLANGNDAVATSVGRQPRNYNVLGIEPRYTQRWTLGALRHDVTVGYRYLRERADERNLNFKLSDASRGVARDSANGTDAHALYVDDQIAVGRWRLTPGLRYEHIAMDRTNVLNGFGEERKNNKALPSLNLSYLLNRELTLYGNYNTSFGSIQHLQLNLQSSADRLQPETARTVELGARYQGAQWKLEGTLFNLDFSNQIAFVNTAPLFYQNIGKTRHRGLESRAEYDFARDGLLAGLNAYATYAYTNATQRQGKYAGNDVPFYARHVDTLGLRLQRGAWRVDINSTHQSRQFADDANTVAENAAGSIGEIPGYRLWNANLSWLVAGRQKLEVQVGVNNLGNRLTFSRTTDTNLGKLAGAPRMAFVQLRGGF